ncbi:regulation of actin filament depolymerization [Balamuthia mandrillaris]
MDTRRERRRRRLQEEAAAASTTSSSASTTTTTATDSTSASSSSSSSPSSSYSSSSVSDASPSPRSPSPSAASRLSLRTERRERRRSVSPQRSLSATTTPRDGNASTSPVDATSSSSSIATVSTTVSRASQKEEPTTDSPASSSSAVPTTASLLSSSSTAVVLPVSSAPLGSMTEEQEAQWLAKLRQEYNAMPLEQLDAKVATMEDELKKTQHRLDVALQILATLEAEELDLIKKQKDLMEEEWSKAKERLEQLLTDKIGTRLRVEYLGDAERNKETDRLQRIARKKESLDQQQQAVHAKVVSRANKKREVEEERNKLQKELELAQSISTERALKATKQEALDKENLFLNSPLMQTMMLGQRLEEAEREKNLVEETELEGFVLSESQLKEILEFSFDETTEVVSKRLSTRLVRFHVKKEGKGEANIERMKEDGSIWITATREMTRFVVEKIRICSAKFATTPAPLPTNTEEIIAEVMQKLRLLLRPAVQEEVKAAVTRALATMEYATPARVDMLEEQLWLLQNKMSDLPATLSRVSAVVAAQGGPSSFANEGLEGEDEIDSEKQTAYSKKLEEFMAKLNEERALNTEHEERQKMYQLQIQALHDERKEVEAELMELREITLRELKEREHLEAQLDLMEGKGITVPSAAQVSEEVAASITASSSSTVPVASASNETGGGSGPSSAGGSTAVSPTVSRKEKGAASAASNIKKSLIQICKREGRLHARMVEPVAASLNKADVFILDLGSKIFSWNGVTASRSKRTKGMDVAVRMNKYQRAGKAEITVIEDEQEEGPEEFWEALEGKPAYIPKMEVEPPPIKDTLYRVLGIQAVPMEGKLTRSRLDSQFVWILDCGTEVYVWCGKRANAQRQNDAKKAVKELYQKHERPSWAVLKKINEAKEPVLFQEKFEEWKTMSSAADSGGVAKADKPTPLNNKGGRKGVVVKGPGGASPSASAAIVPPAAATGGATNLEAILEAYDQTYSYEQLKSGDYPASVDESKKESYLSDAEFQKLFGMDKAAFYKQPAWKITQDKKKLKLF